MKDHLILTVIDNFLSDYYTKSESLDLRVKQYIYL